MKYFKTIVHYEVLSEDAPFEGSLEDLAYECKDGAMSGRFLPSDVTEITPDEARVALRDQGSDSNFLYGLDDVGEGKDMAELANLLEFEIEPLLEKLK